MFFDYLFVNEKKSKSLIKKAIIKEYISNKLICITKK
jgi:hypothetical protein